MGVSIRTVSYTHLGEKFQPVDKGFGLLPAPLDCKGEDGACPLGEIGGVQVVIGAVGQSGVVDPFHLGMPRQIVNHL